MIRCRGRLTDDEAALFRRILMREYHARGLTRDEVGVLCRVERSTA